MITIERNDEVNASTHQERVEQTKRGETQDNLGRLLDTKIKAR